MGPEPYKKPQVHRRIRWWTGKRHEQKPTRGERDFWGGVFLKMAGPKLQLKFTLIRTTGLTPPSHRKLVGFSDSNFKTIISGFPFCGTCSQVPFRNWLRSLERSFRTEARAADLVFRTYTLHAFQRSRALLTRYQVQAIRFFSSTFLSWVVIVPRCRALSMQTTQVL